MPVLTCRGELLLSRLKNGLNNIIRRAYVTLTNADDKNCAHTQVSSMDKIMDIEAIYPYGLFAQAPLNSLALIFSIQNNEENIAGICYAATDRFKNLKPGEVLLGNVSTGTYIKMDKEGNIEIVSKNDINATIDGNVNLTAQQVIVNSAAITLGDPLTAQPMARAGDQITVNIAGTNYIGTITSGSGQNKSS